jgi:heme A synthase
MTTHTRTGRPVTDRSAGHYINRNHTVTGTPTQLANILANHRNAGTLVALTAPRPIGDQFQVVIRLREYQPAVRTASVGEYTRTRIRRPRRGTRIAVIVTAVTGTVAGLAAIGAYLLGQLVEFIAAHAGLILAVLALAAILATAAARRNTSGRRHCPGC